MKCLIFLAAILIVQQAENKIPDFYDKIEDGGLMIIGKQLGSLKKDLCKNQQDIRSFAQKTINFTEIVFDLYDHDEKLDVVKAEHALKSFKELSQTQLSKITVETEDIQTQLSKIVNNFVDIAEHTLQKIHYGHFRDENIIMSKKKAVSSLIESLNTLQAVSNESHDWSLWVNIVKMLDSEDYQLKILDKDLRKRKFFIDEVKELHDYAQEKESSLLPSLLLRRLLELKNEF